MTVVPSPAGPDDWTTRTVITLVPVPVNVAVALLPVVVTVAGEPPSKVHWYARIVEVAPDTDAVKMTV